MTNLTQLHKFCGTFCPVAELRQSKGTLLVSSAIIENNVRYCDPLSSFLDYICYNCPFYLYNSNPREQGFLHYLTERWPCKTGNLHSKEIRDIYICDESCSTCKGWGFDTGVLWKVCHCQDGANITYPANCPTCQGTGKLKTDQLVWRYIYRLEKIAKPESVEMYKTTLYRGEYHRIFGFVDFVREDVCLMTAQKMGNIIG
jgi:hypothetical protein